jgi:hypothetical protein
MTDNVAPYVSNNYPDNNERSVSINTLITVTFSEAMNVGSINTSTINVFKAEPPYTRVDGTVSYEAVTRRAIFTPDDNLTVSTKYKVLVVGLEDAYAKVKTGCKDAAGNYMDGTFSYIFYTGTATSTDPTTAALPSGVTGYGNPTEPVASGQLPLTGYLAVEETDPAHRDTMVSVNSQIKIQFNDHPSVFGGVNSYGTAVYGVQEYASPSGFLANYIDIENREVLGDLNGSALPLKWTFKYNTGNKVLTIKPKPTSKAANKTTSHWYNYGVYTLGSYAYGVLEESNEYTVTIKDGMPGTTKNALPEDYCFFFTTQMDPMYSSVEVMRLNLGSLIADVPDDTLNRIICENGRYALLIYKYDVRDTGVPWYLPKFVECKSKLDALNAQFLGMGAIGGRKVLADFTVDRGNQGKDIMALAGPKIMELQLCVQEMEARLIAGGSVAGTDWAAPYSNDSRHPITDSSWRRLPRITSVGGNIKRPGLPMRGGAYNFQKRRRF